jgi:hypothetical protein
MRGFFAAGALAACLVFFSISGARADGDRHAGYYYPKPQTQEIYTARSRTLPEANRALRIGFVTGTTIQQFDRPYPPQVAVFAKGTEAEKLIIVGLVDGRLDTLYRARAIFANMTAAARQLPAFAEMGVQDYFTFFDLVKMLGFKQITISNGREFAHRVVIE